MTPNTLIERNSDMVVAEMDGELVMMDVEQGSYFSINLVGSHIWSQLETPHTLAALIDSVKQSFQADDPSAIEDDVARFLADLAANKLIREVAS